METILKWVLEKVLGAGALEKLDKKKLLAVVEKLERYIPLVEKYLEEGKKVLVKARGYLEQMG